MWLLQCSLLVQLLASKAAYYHEPSMTTIEPPEPLATDAFFGYSVAYQHNGLIASAPRADKDGQVFSCDLATGNCSRMHFTIGGTRNEKVCHADTGDCKFVHHTHNFWLGATVKSDQKNVFVCAPRFTANLKVNIHPDKPEVILGTNGVCYVKNSIKDFSEMTQISEDDRNFGATANENVTDSFGWSTDIDAKGALRVGSPALAAGRVIRYDDVWDRSQPNIIYSPKKSGFNFGYSIASGVFIHTSRKPRSRVGPGYAIGTPYGVDGTGQVCIFGEKQDWLYTIKDPAGVGSMFSAALCAAELDGATTSLLVGAPAHFTGKNYHTGIVYVYRQYRQNRRQPTIKIFNEIKGPNKDGGFFGYAIANVGDMDHDQKDEIAIAAPYEDGGRGAVYLYAGSALRDGKMDPKWLQRLQPEAPGFRSLGVSLVADRYFGDRCNQLAVGAPGNNRVAVYHCLTVINVDVKAMKPNLQNRANKTHFAFDLCINVKYPPKPDKIKVDFAVRVNITHPNVTLTDANGDINYIDYNQTLDKTSEDSCQKIFVTTSVNGDYDQEIEFNITAKLLNDPMSSTEFDPSRVSVSSNSNLTTSLSVRAAECKKEPCEPILTVSLTSSVAKSPYLIGSSKVETISVVVSNGDADTAYRPCVRVRSTGAALLKAPQCTVVGNRQKVCQLQRPLKKNTAWDVTQNETMEIDMTSLTSKSDQIQITAEVFNRCEMSKEPDHNQMIEIYLTTDISGLKIESKTDQGLVPFNKEDIRKGKTLHHTYIITNMGEINWVDLYCNITLYKQPYIIYNRSIQIYIDATARRACELTDNSDGRDVRLGCQLGNLNRKQAISVVIPVTVLPGALEKVFEKANGTVRTFLKLHAESRELDKEEVSRLVLQEATVPIWVILAATAVGIIILVLIAFALRECGFLRRKKKEKLENLQNEVKRKSMMLQRQSTRLTDSARAELRRLTYRKLLDAAEIKEAEEGEEAAEAAEPKEANAKHRRVKIEQPEVNKRRTIFNGNSSVSNLDLRAEIEKKLQGMNSKGQKSDKTPLCNKE